MRWLPGGYQNCARFAARAAPTVARIVAAVHPAPETSSPRASAARARLSRSAAARASLRARPPPLLPPPLLLPALRCHLARSACANRLDLTLPSRARSSAHLRDRSSGGAGHARATRGGRRSNNRRAEAPGTTLSTYCAMTCSDQSALKPLTPSTTSGSADLTRTVALAPDGVPAGTWSVSCVVLPSLIVVVVNEGVVSKLCGAYASGITETITETIHGATGPVDQPVSVKVALPPAGTICGADGDGETL